MAKRPVTVTCPSCGEPRESRAAGGMKLKCKGCGEPFRMPSAGSRADELPEGRLAAHSSPGEAPGPIVSAASEGTPAAGTSGITVERATPRVGAPAVDDAVVGDDVDDDEGDEPAVVNAAVGGGDRPPEPTETAEQARLRRQTEAARRGGKSSVYNRMLRREATS